MLKKEQKNVNRFKSHQLTKLGQWLIKVSEDRKEHKNVRLQAMVTLFESSWTKRSLYLHKNYEIFIFSTSYAKYSTANYARIPQLISERVTNLQSISISKSIFWTNKQIWSNQVTIQNSCFQKSNVDLYEFFKDGNTDIKEKEANIKQEKLSCRM